MKKTNYLLPQGLRSRIPALGSVALLEGFGICIGISAFRAGSDFWPTAITALTLLLGGILVGFGLQRRRWLLNMTYSQSGTQVSNCSSRRQNTLDLSQPHREYSIEIPCYVGKGSYLLPCRVYSQTELDCDALIGDGGLKAIERFHLAGAVLIPENP